MSTKKPGMYFVQPDGTATDLAWVYAQMGNYRETLQIHFPGTAQHFLEGTPEGAFRFIDAPYRSSKDQFGNELGSFSFSTRRVDEIIPASTLEEACEIFFKSHSIANYQVLSPEEPLPEIK